MDDDPNATYKILRFYSTGSRARTIARGLSLFEAREHCSLESTHKKIGDRVIWFDGYTREGE